MISKQHYIWVDYAKFLSIFLVVYFHSPPVLSGFAGIFLHLIRIPCFFFLAGLLFKFDKYPTFKQYFIHRSKQLLIPYFCFFILFYTYWLIIGRKTGVADDWAAPFYQPIVEYLRGTPRLVCMPLWFVPCLLVMQCVFYLVFKRIKRLWAVLLLFLFPFIPLLVNLENTPCSLDAVCRGIPFYGMASLYKNEIFQFVEKGKNRIAAFVSLSINLLLSFLLTHQQNDFGQALIELFGSFTILLPVLILMKWTANFVGRSLFVEKMSRNAIIILAFHTYSIIIIQKLILLYSNEPVVFFEGKYILKLIIASGSMLSMILPVWFINKYTPFVLGAKIRKPT